MFAKSSQKSPLGSSVLSSITHLEVQLDRGHTGTPRLMQFQRLCQKNLHSTSPITDPAVEVQQSGSTNKISYCTQETKSVLCWFAVLCQQDSKIGKGLSFMCGRVTCNCRVTAIGNQGLSYTKYELVIYCCCQLNEEKDSAIYPNGVEILKLNL